MHCVYCNVSIKTGHVLCIFWTRNASTNEVANPSLQYLNLNHHHKLNICKPEVHSSCIGKSETAIVSNTRSLRRDSTHMCIY